MDVLNFIIGLVLVTLVIVFTIYEVKRYNKGKEFDSMIFSYDIKIYGGFFILLIIGLTMMYQEIISLF